jgi:hypothetical protein
LLPLFIVNSLIAGNPLSENFSYAIGVAHRQFLQELQLHLQTGALRRQVRHQERRQFDIFALIFSGRKMGLVRSNSDRCGVQRQLWRDVRRRSAVNRFITGRTTNSSNSRASRPQPIKRTQARMLSSFHKGTTGSTGIDCGTKLSSDKDRLSPRWHQSRRRYLTAPSIAWFVPVSSSSTQARSG